MKKKSSFVFFFLIYELGTRKAGSDDDGGVSASAKVFPKTMGNFNYPKKLETPTRVDSFFP